MQTRENDTRLGYAAKEEIYANFNLSGLMAIAQFVMKVVTKGIAIENPMDLFSTLSAVGAIVYYRHKYNNNFDAKPYDELRRSNQSFLLFSNQESLRAGFIKSAFDVLLLQCCIGTILIQENQTGQPANTLLEVIAAMGAIYSFICLFRFDANANFGAEKHRGEVMRPGR